MAQILTVGNSFDGHAAYVAPFALDGTSITSGDDNTFSFTLPDDPAIGLVMIQSPQLIYVSAKDDAQNPGSSWTSTSQTQNPAPRLVVPGQTLYFYTPKAANISIQWYALKEP